MEEVRRLPNTVYAANLTQSPARTDREDWEDWETDEVTTPVTASRPPLKETSSPPPATFQRDGKADTRPSITRQTTIKPLRLKSRLRQKAQNAKAGIRLDTDVSKYRRQQQQQAALASQSRQMVGSPDDRTGRFVDAAALRALEGDPSSATVGSFAWLKKRPSQGRKRKQSTSRVTRGLSEQDLSPNDRPIVIGISLPEDDLVNKVISPQTAVIETPIQFPAFSSTQISGNASVGNTASSQQQSVWSPDTEDAGSPFRGSRAASSIYSQYGNIVHAADAPPVPAVPSHFQHDTISPVADEDSFTPVTLFEEDGNSPVARRKSNKPKNTTKTPTSSSSRMHGWWDSVTSPFVAETPVLPATSPRREARDKGPESHIESTLQLRGNGQPAIPVNFPRFGSTPTTTSTATMSDTKNPFLFTDAETSSSVASSSRMTGAQPLSTQSTSEKAHIISEEDPLPTDLPPPYTPAPSAQPSVRYKAVFPPDHSLQPAYPPSPGPISPGLARTMTSQGAIRMTDLPLTPSSRTQEVPLPDRVAGTFVTGDHFGYAQGRGYKVERARRRHEKEDAIARRIGGFWKGRGCMPEHGCYGRSGREGRKRRRICFGIAALVVIIIILVSVLLAVLLNKHTAGAPEYSPWLNLTNFPPIPTGVSTVVGPDNSEAVSACTKPSTQWSCSLPKERRAVAGAFKPNQPTFILQIQYDNNTRQLWNVPNPSPPNPGNGQLDGDSHLLPSKNVTKRAEQLFDTGIAPSPKPPSFYDQWFIGNTTDGILSKDKAGEPTPFYISFLSSVNATLGPNMITKRGPGNGIASGPTNDSVPDLATILPPPELNPDGTGAPARLYPLPSQQPLRLFDRGLATEHYGFYVYYNKTIYLKSIDVNDADQQGVVPADTDGGSLESGANWLVTWSSSRFLVQIWTRKNTTARLISPPAGTAAQNANTTQPGSFPYPITLKIDTHGGDHDLKGTYAMGVDDRQHINVTNSKLVFNFIDFDSPVINPANKFLPAYGGFDGGTGGCRCSWTNFRGTSGSGP